MWLCFNDAFLSVVQLDQDPKVLMVRARSHKHLQNVFGNVHKIHITPENDYRYRIYINRQELMSILEARVWNLNYSNFKDSVQENKLHNMYTEFWYLHKIYQDGKHWWKRQQKAWLNALKET